MRKYEAGQVYGRWTLVRLSQTVGTQGRWLCRCECGTEKEVSIANVASGKSRSCGCYHKQRIREALTTHGLSKHPIYNSWASMINRCTSPKNRDFQYYGARGINVCERWWNFQGFADDMFPTWQPGMTIDRIDPNGDYEPTNCRWLTIAEQQRNKRSNVLYDTPWGRITLPEAARKMGLSLGGLQGRIKSGRPMEEVFSLERFRAPRRAR